MPVGFSAIKPQFYDVEAIASASEDAVDEVAKGMLEDFEQTTRTWDHKVNFVIIETRRGGSYSVGVGTDDDIYKYVDKGTRAHTIRPRRANYLRFREGHRAKTRRGRLKSGRGGSFGGFVYRKRVRHPGTEARDFTGLIEKRWKRPSVRLIQKRLTRAFERYLR